VSAEQSAAIFTWTIKQVEAEALRINQPFDGWRLDPTELFGADDSQADLDGDQAFSHAELVSAVPHVLSKRDLKRWYNFVVDKL